MSSLNKVQLIGNLGNDPEIKILDNGTPVANFSIATSETWKDQTGKQQSKTEWHKITAWRALAEICDKFLRKGNKVYVEGKLQTRSWKTDNGGKRYSTEINAKNILFLTPKAQNEQTLQPPPQNQNQYSYQPPQQMAQNNQQTNQPINSYVNQNNQKWDDIPF